MLPLARCFTTRLKTPPAASPRTIRVIISRSPSRERPRARNDRFPQLLPEQLGHLAPLAAEIIALTQSSARYTSLGPNLITDSATMLARYGIPNIESFRRVGKQARTYLFEDLRRRWQELAPSSVFNSYESKLATSHPRWGYE